jgi:hypothetical protein
MILKIFINYKHVHTAVAKQFFCQITLFICVVIEKNNQINIKTMNTFQIIASLVVLVAFIVVPAFKGAHRFTANK